MALHGSLGVKMRRDESDSGLLRAYATERSEAAFQALVERHLGLVYGVALRLLGEPANAKEVAQLTFLALSRKANFLLHHQSLAAWLYHAASLEARQRIRTDLRRRERETAAAETISLMNANDANWQALTPDLDEGLRQLPEKDRHALLLRFFEQKSLREVGVALGIGEDAARKRVDSALEKLTRIFRRRGLIVPGFALTAATLRGSAMVAPAGLAAAITQSVMVTGGAAASGIGLLFARFMSLAKTQTVVACVLLSVAPFWRAHHRLARAEAEGRALAGQLAASKEELARREAEQSDARARVARLAGSLGAARNSLEWEGKLANRPLPAGRLYEWQPDSDYVRVPKRVIDSLALADLAQHFTTDGIHKLKAIPDRKEVLTDLVVEVLGLTEA
ncbi:MAG TPA: sigma-70 family RNA polymerase sigma factor, partial [Verrucomicrobiae bacterium]|nr:sigma-70 family RNA polymerase sigma factor [Verrucomicrobiae bacterium]